jgi:hypothetical protein
MARADELFGNNLPPRARAVVDAFLDARTSSTSFALACGLLPELSESCTESLHGHVHALSETHFDREPAVARLRATLRDRGLSDEAIDEVEQAVTTLLAADATAAYLFGLAAGIGLGALDRRLGE